MGCDASGVNSRQTEADCPIRMRKGWGRVFRPPGTRRHLAVCAEKSPRSSPETPPLLLLVVVRCGFHDWETWKTHRTAGHLRFILRWKDRLPVLALGTIEAHLLNGLISQIAQSAGINNIVFRCHRASNDVIWASTIIACRRIVRLHSQYDPRFCRLPLKHACRLFCHQEPSALLHLLKMQRNWQTTPPNPVSCVF